METDASSYIDSPVCEKKTIHSVDSAIDKETFQDKSYAQLIPVKLELLCKPIREFEFCSLLYSD